MNDEVERVWWVRRWWWRPVEPAADQPREYERENLSTSGSNSRVLRSINEPTVIVNYVRSLSSTFRPRSIESKGSACSSSHVCAHFELCVRVRLLHAHVRPPIGER